MLVGGVGFANDVDVGELANETTRQTCGQFERLTDLFGGRSRLLVGKAVVDVAGNEDEEEVTVVAREHLFDVLEIVVLDVLRSVGKFGTIKADDPRHLNPQEEEGEGSKRTVDGVVLADPDLSVDVEPLEEEECRTGNNGSCKGVEETNFAVGDDDIDERQEQDGEDIGDTAKDGEQRLTEHVVVEVGHDVGLQEKLCARTDGKEGGDEEDDAEVVGDAA